MGLQGLNQYQARINVLAQGHNTVTPVRLQPATPRSRVKHCTTEPMRFLTLACIRCFPSLYKVSGMPEHTSFVSSPLFLPLCAGACMNKFSPLPEQTYRCNVSPLHVFAYFVFN